MPLSTSTFSLTEVKSPGSSAPFIADRRTPPLNGTPTYGSSLSTLDPLKKVDVTSLAVKQSDDSAERRNAGRLRR
jgi:hypothetical protein